MLMNPYLDYFNALPPSFHRFRRQAFALNEAEIPGWLPYKNAVAAFFAWAVPTEEAIATVVNGHCDRIVEIGSGSGYWAWMLEQSGAQVEAFDAAAPKFTWRPVRRGTSADAARFPDHALMLCWPPWGSPMGCDALRAYRGDTVVYVGEWMKGCAEPAFFALLREEFEAVDGAVLPQWPLRDDALVVFRRRRLPFAR